MSKEPRGQGNVNRVTGGPSCDLSHNGTPDVVTVYPTSKRTMTTDHYMRALYHGGMSTAEIAAKICNATEADVFHAVFGKRQRSRT